MHASKVRSAFADRLLDTTSGDAIILVAIVHYGKCVDIGMQTTAKAASNDCLIYNLSLRQLNSTAISRIYPFAFKRFHALLNSLFKVLFNFRSRYLFAIGLTVIFSLTRTIPGALCSRVEEHDSIIVKWARTHSKPVTYGTFTLYGTLIGGHPPPEDGSPSPFHATFEKT